MRARRHVLVFASYLRTTLSVSAVLALALPLLTGCDKSPKERLQGRWQGVGVEGLTGSAAKSAEGWARQTTLEFSGPNVTVSVPAEAPQSGTYSVAKIDGDHITVRFKRSDKSREDAADFKFAKDGKLVWTVGGADIVLAKATD